MTVLAGPNTPDGADDSRLYDGIEDLFPPEGLSHVLSTLVLGVAIPTRDSLMALGRLLGESPSACAAAIDEAIETGKITVDTQGICSTAENSKQVQAQFQRSRFHPSPIWNGSWIALSFPDGIENLRVPDKVTDVIKHDHFRELRSDVWIRPDNLGSLDRLPPADSMASDFSVSTEQVDQPRRTAAELWDLDALSQRSAELITTAECFATDTADEIDQHIPQAWILGCAIGTMLQHDPLLPPALLPPAWSMKKLAPTMRMLSLQFREAFTNELHMDFPPGS